MGELEALANWMRSSGIGMVVSAQWELVLGNSYGYTVLSAFGRFHIHITRISTAAEKALRCNYMLIISLGLFYAGFGAIITPIFGVSAAYGTDTAEFNNALGFFVLSEYC